MNSGAVLAPAFEDVRRFESVDRLVETLALEMAQEIDAALTARGRALIALSGGRTPEPLYRRLGEASIAWSGVTCVLVDERVVPADSPDSNASLLNKSLFAGPAGMSALEPLWLPLGGPGQAADAAERRLRSLGGPFDLVLLGMGDDGHTASLFPGSAALVEGLDPASRRLCLPVAAMDPAPVQPRLTLTLAAILNARRIVLMITGRRKLEVLEAAFGGDDACAMPIRAVLNPSRTPVAIVWAP